MTRYFFVQSTSEAFSKRISSRLRSSRLRFLSHIPIFSYKFLWRIPHWNVLVLTHALYSFFSDSWFILNKQHETANIVLFLQFLNACHVSHFFQNTDWAWPIFCVYSTEIKNWFQLLRNELHYISNDTMIVIFCLKRNGRIRASSLIIELMEDQSNMADGRGGGVALNNKQI